MKNIDILKKLNGDKYYICKLSHNNYYISNEKKVIFSSENEENWKKEVYSFREAKKLLLKEV